MTHVHSHLAPCYPALQSLDYGLMCKLKVLDLFAGIGGASLGLERTSGFKTSAFCENHPHAQDILRKNWPGVPVYDDVTTLSFQRLFNDGVSVDVICGGFPCQDISPAGKQGGITASRSGLWSELCRIVGEVRPRYAVVENVPNLLSGPDKTGGWFGRVLGDLVEIGYDAEWHCLQASSVGAPHPRDRVWIVAYPCGSRGQRLVAPEDFSKAGSWGWRGQEDLRDIASSPYVAGTSWPQPLVRGVDDGISNRLDRLERLGNSIVPQIMECIGYAMLRGVLDGK